MELSSSSKDFHKIWYLSIFRKSFEKIQISLKSKRIIGTLHKDQNTFLQYRTKLLLELEIFRTKFVEEIKRRISYTINVFRKSCRLWDIVEKYCGAEQATGANMAHVHCVLDISGYKYSDYIILTAFPLRQWLQECASLSCIACLVNITVLSTGNGQNNGNTRQYRNKTLCWLHWKNISCIFRYSFVCLYCVVPVSQIVFSNRSYGSGRLVGFSKRTNCWRVFSWSISNQNGHFVRCVQCSSFQGYGGIHKSWEDIIS